MSEFSVVAEIAEIWRRRREAIAEAEARVWNNQPISRLRLLKEVRDVLPKDCVIQLAGGSLVNRQCRI